MNIRDLQYLVTAAKTEHFGQAAEFCNVSQPTLSGQIRKLEETLGVVLFERSHRAVVLTDTGREITAHAQQILQQVQRLEALAQSRQNPLTGYLRIGIIPTLCAYLLPYFLLPLKTRYPGLCPVIIEETTKELVQQLHNHDIDVALLATAHDAEGLASDVLFDEPLWLAVSAKHALAERRCIGRQDLHGLPILTLAAGHCLADRVRELCGIASTPAQGAADLRATSLETLLQLVAAGQGVTLVPALVVEHARSPGNKIVFLPLDLQQGFRQIRQVYRRSSSRLPALDGLAAMVQETLPLGLSVGSENSEFTPNTD